MPRGDLADQAVSFRIFDDNIDSVAGSVVGFVDVAGARNLPRVHSVGAMLVELIASNAPLVAAVRWAARRQREPQQKAA